MATIINNDSNLSTDGLDNKSLKHKKGNKSTNIEMITKELDFDKLCNSCIGSKHIQIINHKLIIPITQKLEAVHGDLWGPYDPTSFTGSQYRVLLFNKFMRKSWIFFICLKDIFFDTFKPWLEKVKIKT